MGKTCITLLRRLRKFLFLLFNSFLTLFIIQNNQNSLNVKKRSEELLSKMSKKNKEDILFSDLLDDDDTELTARSSFVTLLHLVS